MLTYDLDKIDRWLALNQPGLKINIIDDAVIVDGTYALCDQTGINGPQIFETFEIEFVVPDDFPQSLPRVYETAERIPRLSDNHINDDGSICFGVPSIISAKRPNLTLIPFVDEILHDYFLGYLHFLEFGEWPFGEISHGYMGVVEELAEILDCKPDARKVKALVSLLSKKHRRDRWPCPCGSPKKLGKCCRPALNKASTRMSRSEARLLIALIGRVKQRDEYVKLLNKVAQLEKQMAKTQFIRNRTEKTDMLVAVSNKKFGAHTVSPLAMLAPGFSTQHQSVSVSSY